MLSRILSKNIADEKRCAQADNTDLLLMKEFKIFQQFKNMDRGQIN